MLLYVAPSSDCVHRINISSFLGTLSLLVYSIFWYQLINIPLISDYIYIRLQIWGMNAGSLEEILFIEDIT